MHRPPISPRQAVAALALAAAPVAAVQATTCQYVGVTQSALQCIKTGTNSETGSRLEASATFRLDNGQLGLTLENTSTDDVRAPSDILQAALFDIRQDINLSLVGAVLTPGSTLNYCNETGIDTRCTPSDGILPLTKPGPGESKAWDYRSAPDSSGIQGHDHGVSAAGLDYFHGVKGMDYGLLSSGDDLSTPTSNSMNKNGPMTRNGVELTFDMSSTRNTTPGSLSLPDMQVRNVDFNYGTSWPVPAPGSLALMGLGVLGLATARRRATDG